MKPNDESLAHRTQSQNGYRRDFTTLSSSQSFSQIKVITLRRKTATAPLGFSIRGGWEHGTGIFVSEVQAGSVAQRQGLRVGDQIVRINGFSIHRAIHMEALSLLKTSPGLVLKVKRVGILPVKDRRRDPVTWKVVDTDSIPPKSAHENSRTHEYIPENCVIVKIEFSVPGCTSLGCSIAKGPLEMPGIFMCTVKDGGLADEAGLQVGDQIMEMNGTSFYDIKLADAVTLMKSNKDIKLTVKKGAGACLFSESRSSRDHMPPPPPLLMNGRDNSNGNTPMNSEATLRRQRNGLKNHDFCGSTSSKSEEESSFRSSAASSDSEKDYSLSEESGIHSLKPQNGYLKGRHKKSASVVTSESGGSNSSSGEETTRIEDGWLVGEKRRIEEEQRKLMAEQQRLEEEKRRLALLEEKSSSVNSKDPPRPGFLQELQKVAAKMTIKDDKMTIDQILMERRNGEQGNDGTLKRGDGSRSFGEKDVVKKKQHEMLMEEFREAHRKMFGQQTMLPMDLKVNEETQSLQYTISGAEYPSCKITSPPAPPPKSSHKSKITVNGQTVQSQTLPRPERNFTNSRLPKTSMDDMDSRTNSGTTTASSHQVNFRITFDTKHPSEMSANLGSKNQQPKGTLVQVKPWATRL